MKYVVMFEMRKKQGSPDVGFLEDADGESLTTDLFMAERFELIEDAIHAAERFNKVWSQRSIIRSIRILRKQEEE